MTLLEPLPSTLGLSSPAIGPWFVGGTGQTVAPLAVPDSDLSIPLPSLANVEWRPPASGTLGFFIASEQRPPGLATLRQADGQPAFTDGHLVALFRLLPEVEERLHALLGWLPRADLDASDQVRTNPDKLPTRARVRWLAIELPMAEPTLQDVQRFAPWPVPDPVSVGLAIVKSRLANGPVPMADLRRPGVVLNAAEALLRFGDATAGARLWAFDAGGRPIDPGAVARWWSYLATTVFQDTLWAKDVAKVTAAVAPGRSVHLVNAHEGRLIGTTSALADPLLTRIERTRLGIDGVVCAHTDTAPAIVAFPTDSSGEVTPFVDARIPRVAALPLGEYGAAAKLWGASALDRDFVRVALTDIERNLVGSPGASAGNFSARRIEDQQRASTRVRCERTQAQAPTLLATTDLAADAVLSVLTGDGPARLVTSVLDADWAGLDAAVLPDVEPVGPTATAAVALIGGGTASGDTIAGQQILLELDFPAALVGAWVRAWPQQLDPALGRLVRLEGGSARVRAISGGARASILLPIPGGSTDVNARLGADLLVVTRRRSRRVADVRFPRPAPTGGVPVALSAVTGKVLVCDSGTEVDSPAGLAGIVTSGATLVALGEAPALIDRASLPASIFTADTAVRLLAAGDIVELTEPAFVGIPAGDPVARIAATGATVRRHLREGLTRAVTAGAPLPSQERLELGASRSGAAPVAAIAATPALGRYHELLPHRSGHPGAPAAVDIHGTGAYLSHRAAVCVAEALRDRTEHSTYDLALAAKEPAPEPAPPTGPTPWASVLRTVAVGIEGEPKLLQQLGATSLYPFGGTLAEIVAWIANVIPSFTLPSTTAEEAARIVRALDRRVLLSMRGARETVTSLIGAIVRAEDLVYIETPALDELTFGDGPGDIDDLAGVLAGRLEQNRALSLILCVPVAPLPGAPAGYRRVRDRGLLAVIDRLRRIDDRRVAVFSPGAGAGRTLRLASTSVVVDDVYALTGSTHLSRRGLSFDSSLAVSIFDERLEAGRPREVRRFRRELLAGRLGLPLALLPDSPAELCAAIQQLVRQGSDRLAQVAPEPPEEAFDALDDAVWNPDGGSTPAALDVSAWLAGIVAERRAELEAAVNDSPQP